MSAIDVGLYALDADRQIDALGRALRARGAALTHAAPPSVMKLAWRVSRRLAGRSVAARMAARAAFAEAFTAWAARRIAHAGHDVVVTDLATAGAVRGSARRHVLVLERGSSDAIHAALDAEVERAPAFRSHLSRYRASAASCRREREAIAAAACVVAPSRWIARSARAAGARHVVIAEPPAPAFPWHRVDRGRRPLRIVAPGCLIGRNGAHALLECAYWMAETIHLTIAGRVADDAAAVNPYTPYFRAAGESFEDCCREADVVVAPWLIAGYSRDVARARASGIPTIATEATGVDVEQAGVKVVREGSIEDLVGAVEGLQCIEAREALVAGLPATPVSAASEAALADAVLA